MTKPGKKLKNEGSSLTEISLITREITKEREYLQDSTFETAK